MRKLVIVSIAAIAFAGSAKAQQMINGLPAYHPYLPSSADTYWNTQMGNDMRMQQTQQAAQQMQLQMQQNIQQMQLCVASGNC
jgi:hypothetical protein